jgi:hypothetical protein
MLDPDTSALLNQLGYDAGFIESLLSGAIWLTVVALITAIPTGIIAARKGRSRTVWFLLALSIPVVPLLLVWLLPKLPEKTE